MLNPEIAPVLSESVKNRDKLLQKSQNLLGLGISGLTNITSSLIDGDIEKIELIRRLSDVSQLFLDLHCDNTKTRRKLVVSSLDKKFTGMISEKKLKRQKRPRDLACRLGDKIQVHNLKDPHIIRETGEAHPVNHHSTNPDRVGPAGTATGHKKTRGRAHLRTVVQLR